MYFRLRIDPLAVKAHAKSETAHLRESTIHADGKIDAKCRHYMQMPRLHNSKIVIAKLNIIKL